MNIKKIINWILPESALKNTAMFARTEFQAKLAMKLLRFFYNKEYGWCADCDGLVVKSTECCKNKEIQFYNWKYEITDTHEIYSFDVDFKYVGRIKGDTFKGCTAFSQDISGWDTK